MCAYFIIFTGWVFLLCGRLSVLHLSVNTQASLHTIKSRQVSRAMINAGLLDSQNISEYIMLLNHLNTSEIDMIITSILRSTGGKKQTRKTSQILIDYLNVTGLTNYGDKSITLITVILAMLD